MICHPVKRWLLPKRPLCDSLPLPLKRSRSFRSVTRAGGYPHSLPPTKMQSLPPAPDSGTVGEGLFSKKGNRFAASPIGSERVPIGAIQSLITTNKGGGGTSSSAAPVFTPSCVWLAPRREACPSLEMEMLCVRIEVSEVWGLAEEGTKVAVLLVLWNDLV